MTNELWKLPGYGKGGKIKNHFPSFPQPLENSPLTLRVSHSSHSSGD